MQYRYQSLEDFLIANELTADGQLDDGWGASFPVKGREIDAVVLFADISAFSARTRDLSPTETLIFVNNFFAWISAEALHGRPGIVDKYIGDEIMIVFSKEFGSDDPMNDAIRAAFDMAEHDVLAYQPHIGIAAGRVLVGYVGTPLKYNCSVFGAPVATAARCAGVKIEDEGHFSTSVIIPENDWSGRNLDEVMPPRIFTNNDGTEHSSQSWEALDPRSVPFKNMGEVTIRPIVRRGFWGPSQGATDRAKDCYSALQQMGRIYERVDLRSDTSPSTPFLGR